MILYFGTLPRFTVVGRLVEFSGGTRTLLHALLSFSVVKRTPSNCPGSENSPPQFVTLLGIHPAPRGGCGSAGLRPPTHNGGTHPILCLINIFVNRSALKNLGDHDRGEG